MGSVFTQLICLKQPGNIFSSKEIALCFLLYLRLEPSGGAWSPQTLVFPGYTWNSHYRQTRSFHYISLDHSGFQYQLRRQKISMSENRMKRNLPRAVPEPQRRSIRYINIVFSFVLSSPMYYQCNNGNTVLLYFFFFGSEPAPVGFCLYTHTRFQTSRFSNAATSTEKLWSRNTYLGLYKGGAAQRNEYLEVNHGVWV